MARPARGLEQTREKGEDWAGHGGRRDGVVVHCVHCLHEGGGSPPAEGPHIERGGDEEVELNFGGGEGGTGATVRSGGIFGAGIGECVFETTGIRV